jgi:hypothetical protein
MRTLRMTAAAASLFGSVLLPPGTTEAQMAAPGIPGHTNSMTRELVPAVSSLQRSGTVTITVNAAITSNIPLTQTITCQVQLSTSFFDPSFQNFALVTTPLKRLSAKSGTCKVVVPYIFVVSKTTTTMMVTTSLSVFTFGTTTVLLDYSSSNSFALASVPNGNTSRTINLAV